MRNSHATVIVLKNWHRVVGHNWRQSCRLCEQVRFHVDGQGSHEFYFRCRCGATAPWSLPTRETTHA